MVGFDNPVWRNVKCATLAIALDIGKNFKCDPGVAVAWCGERKRTKLAPTSGNSPKVID